MMTEVGKEKKGTNIEVKRLKDNTHKHTRNKYQEVGIPITRTKTSRKHQEQFKRIETNTKTRCTMRSHPREREERDIKA